jgi:excisionase family DNA binding protein
MPQEPKRRFLTIEQVAKELNVGKPLVQALLRNGDLRGMQIGSRGKWRVASTDAEDYINQAYKTTADRIAAGDLPEDGGESDQSARARKAATTWEASRSWE